MRRILSAVLCLCMVATIALLPGCASKSEAGNKSSMFRGLAPDEMIITSYLAPWPEYKRDGEVIWRGLEDATAFHYLKEAGINYVEDNNRIRFGNYSTLNAEGTLHGTLVFEGEWLELKNYYIQNGYTVQQFINAIYSDVTKKLAANENAKFVYYKVNGKTINVYRFVQNNHMWKNGNVLEYAIRLNGAIANTVYTGVAFSVAGEKVTLSENVKSVTHK